MTHGARSSPPRHSPCDTSLQVAIVFLPLFDLMWIREKAKEEKREEGEGEGEGRGAEKEGEGRGE